jgi:hypothetical protein
MASPQACALKPSWPFPFTHFPKRQAAQPGLKMLRPGRRRWFPGKDTIAPRTWTGQIFCREATVCFSGTK